MTLRVLQHGCFGTRNYGDERSALAVRTLVRRSYPDAEFYLIGSNAEAIQKEHTDVADWATREDWDKVQALMAKADLWIYGPGTVLGPNPMPKTLELMAMGKPFIIWGAGAWEPIPAASDGAKVVRAAAAVSVRDRYARCVVEEHRRDVVSVPDPMFLEAVFSERTWRAITVSWHLARQPEAVQDRVLDVLAAMIRVTEEEWIALPASWSETTDWDNDHVLHRRLAERAPLTLVWPQSFAHLQQLLGTVQLIVTSRLHMGIPVLGGGGRCVWFGQQKCQVMAETLGEHAAYAGDYQTMTARSILSGAMFQQQWCSPQWEDEGPLMQTFIEKALGCKQEGGQP